MVLPANFQAGISDNRVSLNAGFDRHPLRVSLARPRFVLLPSPIMTATPFSISLSLSSHPSSSPRSFSRLFLARSRSWLCATIVRRSIAPRWPTTTKRIRVYAITSTKERKTPRPRRRKFPFRVPSKARFFCSSRERERGEGEVLFPAANGTGGGEMGGEKMVERWKVLLRAPWWKLFSGGRTNFFVSFRGLFEMIANL